MAQMTPEVSKLLERALSLSVEEQEALADSLISNLGGKVEEGVQAAWEAEIGKRVAELDSGKAKTTPWGEVRRRNLAKLPRARRCCGVSSGIAPTLTQLPESLPSVPLTPGSEASPSRSPSVSRLPKWKTSTTILNARSRSVQVRASGTG
jgi:putative addiction module component (TIGR02574 family)